MGMIQTDPNAADIRNVNVIDSMS
ncbi:hypothetical protein EMEDMD4_440228 [Sinorhizobium medicae]|uniref:Uncharacterized protein n=1 Tax=Sinorhizobium medicae TaxID=110321 RepID=A0A508WZK0_9HYPH|nr:hypothetical protein EMEDMD4_440228 [Sinorhizobium medicae]